MELLHHLPHSALRNAPAPKNVHRVIRNLMCAARRKGLQQANRAAEMFRLVFVAHVVHLIGDLLEPGLVGFNKGDHAGEFLADGGLGDEGLARDDALMGPFEALFEDWVIDWSVCVNGMVEVVEGQRTCAAPAVHAADHHP